MNSLTSNYIEVGGYKIRYKDEGQGDSVLLMLHGFALSCDIWMHNIVPLSEKYRVVALDILGFGESDIPDNSVSMEWLPEFISLFMEKLKIKSATFVGHSMGGLISIWVSQIYPHLVEKLILVGSAGFKMKIHFHFPLLVLPIVGEALLKTNKEKLRWSLQKNTFHPKVITDELVDSLFLAKQKPRRREYYLKACRHAIGFYGLKYQIIHQVQQEVKKLKIPVLLIWGRQDKVIEVGHAHVAQKLIPHAKLLIIEECGHFAQLEKPKEFNSAVLSFLNTKLD